MSATPASTDAKATSRASDAMRRPRVRRALGIGALGVVLAASASALDGATRMLNAKLSTAVRDPEAPAPATRPRAMDDDGDGNDGSHRAFAKTRVRSVREHRLTYDFERDRRGSAGRRRRRRAKRIKEAVSTATESARDDGDARGGGVEDAGVAGEVEDEDEVEVEDDDDEEEAFSSWARMLREEDEDEDEGTGR